MIDPNDLLNKKFEKSRMGGYKITDVDSFMADAATLISRQSREISELKRKVTATQQKLEQYAGEQDSLKEALLSAQRLADSIVREAKARAEQLQLESQTRAEQLVREADAYAQQVRVGAESEIEAKQEELAMIRREVSDFRSRLFEAYRAHLELIRALPAEEVEQMPEPERAEASSSYQEEAAAQTAAAEQTADAEQTAEPEDVPAPELMQTEAESREQMAAEQVLSPETIKPQAEEIPEPAVQPVPDADVPAPEEDTNAPETAAAPTAQDEPEAAAHVMPQIKLNVKFDEETGEYVPLDEQEPGGRKKQPWKF